MTKVFVEQPLASPGSANYTFILITVLIRKVMMVIKMLLLMVITVMTTSSRHGESEWNQQNRFCGWFDANLSDTGVKVFSSFLLPIISSFLPSFF